MDCLFFIFCNQLDRSYSKIRGFKVKEIIKEEKREGGKTIHFIIFVFIEHAHQVLHLDRSNNNIDIMISTVNKSVKLFYHLFFRFSSF